MQEGATYVSLNARGISEFENRHSLDTTACRPTHYLRTAWLEPVCRHIAVVLPTACFEGAGPGRSQWLRARFKRMALHHDHDPHFADWAGNRECEGPAAGG